MDPIMAPESSTRWKCQDLLQSIDSGIDALADNHEATRNTLLWFLEPYRTYCQQHETYDEAKLSGAMLILVNLQESTPETNNNNDNLPQPTFVLQLMCDMIEIPLLITQDAQPRLQLPDNVDIKLARTRLFAKTLRMRRTYFADTITRQVFMSPECRDRVPLIAEILHDQMSLIDDNSTITDDTKRARRLEVFEKACVRVFTPVLRDYGDLFELFVHERSLTKTHIEMVRLMCTLVLVDYKPVVDLWYQLVQRIDDVNASSSTLPSATKESMDSSVSPPSQTDQSDSERDLILGMSDIQLSNQPVDTIPESQPPNTSADERLYKLLFFVFYASSVHLLQVLIDAELVQTKLVDLSQKQQ